MRARANRGPETGSGKPETGLRPGFRFPVSGFRSPVFCLLAACGSSPPPSAPDAPPIACTATLHGDIAELDPCSSADALTITIPSPTLGSITISLDLGAAPTPGAYSPATITTWSASALERIGDGACAYTAGANQTPTGSFVLDLTGVDPPHGALTVEQSVLGTPGTDCGDSDTEIVDVRF